jgi:hypothetical protein
VSVGERGEVRKLAAVKNFEESVSKHARIQVDLRSQANLATTKNDCKQKKGEHKHMGMKGLSKVQEF